MAVRQHSDLSSWVGKEFGVELRTTSSPVRLELTDLVGTALRRNPLRAQLLVSTVLGKHVPVQPNLVAATGRLLGELVAQQLDCGDRTRDWTDLAWRAVRQSDPSALLSELDLCRADRGINPAVVLGFAETATALGHLVADQLLAACYLHSTRRAVSGVQVSGGFEEGHSHAPEHLLLPVPAGLLDLPVPLVLVDDELSTGRTAMATIVQAHRRQPRNRYVLASLIDLRSPEDEAAMAELAAELGCRIDVVSLVRGVVRLPAGLQAAVAARISEPGRPEAAIQDHSTVGHPGPAQGAQSTEPAVVVPASPEVTEIPWPPWVPDGGRHGFLAENRADFDSALIPAAVRLREQVHRRLAHLGGGHRVLVIGTEELMYLPLRLAQTLGSDDDLTVTFQSTTRSPVFPVAAEGYPIGRQLSFADAEGDRDKLRFLYNATVSSPDGPDLDPDLVVVVTDSPADTPILHGPTGLITSLRNAGLPTEVLVMGPVDPTELDGRRACALTRDLPPPLTGPEFGSYSTTEVAWLLTDLSDIDLEGDIEAREATIQAGTAHYAESLPLEFQPDAAYRALFDEVLTKSADRLALAVGRVTELLLKERGHHIVLASLARAGTPIGILIRRWAQFRHGLELPHYALSIVRGRGLDVIALKYLAAHHDSSRVVFVDGWTGKGAIVKELSAALANIRQNHGLEFNEDLAVLADPGHCVRTFGTRDDFLIASACLNSTVSGLISRTVLNTDYLRPDQFHGAKFYRELIASDVSGRLLDEVAAAFPRVVDQVLSGLADHAAADRAATFSGWKALERIRIEYGIESLNFVKPGVGETTRVLLRRVPWRILVREADHPDHAHLRLLARQRGVAVEVRADLPYSCVGLIRRLSDTEPGES